MKTHPKFTLSAVSLDDLQTKLKAINIAVPLATQGETKEHREQDMMARFIATAASVDQLRFPLQVIHGEKPDFMLILAGEKIGVECVEAVPTELRHIEVIREENYPDAMNFGQKFDPGKVTFKHGDKVAIASGKRAGIVWMPRAAQRNWVAAMECVVAGKTAKLRKGNYSTNQIMWLLVQDEWPNSLKFYPDQVRTAADELHKRLAPLFVRPAFQAVFIACGNQLLCMNEDQLSVEKACNLWN